MTCVGLTLIPLLPIFLDIVHPLNQSRDKILIVRTKFPVDPNEYYYLIHLQLVVYVTAIFHVFAGVDPMFLAVLHHFLGLISVIKLVFPEFCYSFFSIFVNLICFKISKIKE